MSGIFGMVLLDGGQPRPADIQAMARELERRGPDGTHIWTEGNVAIGHTLLATTPEALVEILPLTDPDTGCTITADCRLDNREELIGELGLGEIDRVIGDGELILRAYLRWGEDCPVRLLGDFAFAIWDPRQEKLFCARDHMGMRQFIYHHGPGQLFVFASETEALLAHGDVPVTINEGRIGDFLDDLEGSDLESTFYEGLHRLPPAHSIRVTATGVALRSYWELRPQPQIALPSDNAYAETFLEIFTEAVRCRLRSAGPAGAMLSGGVDSGSVAAIAGRLLAAAGRGPLHCYSAVGPDPRTCAETRAIAISSALEGLTSHSIGEEDLVEMHGELRRAPPSSEPFDLQMPMIRAVYLAAHRQAMKIMLDGVAGDVVLVSGNRVAELARRCRFVEAIREAKAEERFWGPAWPARTALIGALWAAWAPNSVRRFRRQALDRISDIRIGRGGLISARFAAAIDLVARRSKYRAHSATGRVWDGASRAAAIKHPHLTAARERYDRVAAALGIEPRDPFMDVRVIEFCLSLPPEQLQSGGWPKLILRRAMRGILPEDVLWRRGKEHLGWAYSLSLLKHWSNAADHLQKDQSLLAPFVRWSALDARNQVSGKELDIAGRFKLLFLLTWLRRSSSRRPDVALNSGKEHAEGNA